MVWESLNLIRDRDEIPVVQCCYALYFDGDLKYIGSTNNLRNRFSGHAIRHGFARNIKTPWGDFSDDTEIVLKYKISKRYGYWLMLEARLIKRLRPQFNSKLKGRQ